MTSPLRNLHLVDSIFPFYNGTTPQFYLFLLENWKMQNRCEIEIVDFEIVYCLMSALRNIQLVPTQTRLLSTSSKKWRFATHWKICRSKFKRRIYSEKGEKLFFNVPVCQKSILILFSSETFGKRINNT